jgi:hypothetical protein
MFRHVDRSPLGRSRTSRGGSKPDIRAIDATGHSGGRIHRIK